MLLTKQEHGLLEKPERPFSFTTKANTLDFLRDKLKAAQILPSFLITVGEWIADKEKVFSRFSQEHPKLLDKFLIVRSSALSEDQAHQSLAGCFESVLNVKGKDALF